MQKGYIPKKNSKNKLIMACAFALKLLQLNTE